MKQILVKEFGQQIYMFEELLALFENACEDLYYGDGKDSWFKEAEQCMSHDDANALWHAAFTFMAEERQPNLQPLENIKLKQS